jgi:hypothetical protein
VSIGEDLRECSGEAPVGCGHRKAYATLDSSNKQYRSRNVDSRVALPKCRTTALRSRWRCATVVERWILQISLDQLCCFVMRDHAFIRVFLIESPQQHQHFGHTCGKSKSACKRFVRQRSPAIRLEPFNLEGVGIMHSIGGAKRLESGSLYVCTTRTRQ